MKPKISVVIPAYNVQDYIEETLLTVFTQTVKPDEIVVVDDASKDRTNWIIEKVFEENRGTVPMLQLITQNENHGIGVSRQLGVNNASGDYIAFLSADDLYQPNFLESSLPFLDGETGTHTDYWRVYMAGGKIPMQRFSCPSYKTQEKLRSLVIQWALELNMFVMFSTVIMPKWWFGHVKFEPTLKHGEDLILLLDTIIKGFWWHHIPEPLVMYRIHPKQGTRTLQKHEWYKTWGYNRNRLMQLGLPEDQLGDAQIKNDRVAYPTPWDRVWNKAKRILANL